MKRKILLIVAAAVVFVGVLFALFAFNRNEYIVKAAGVNANASVWHEQIAKDVNSKNIQVLIDGRNIELSRNEKAYMNSDFVMMIPKDSLKEALDCAVNLYDGEKLIIERGSVRVEANLNSDIVSVNDKTFEIKNPIEIKDGVVYVSTKILEFAFQYEYVWDAQNITATLTSTMEQTSLPSYYNCYENGRIPPAKNQGLSGACWAFAALNALESTLLPEEAYDFSEDHMIANNSFSSGVDDGGDYLMSLAYLAAWQGPVLDEDDPFGDGVSDDTLTPVKHVQEAQFIQSKDFNTIKKMVYKYGAVQSSLYTSMNVTAGYSTYYNPIQQAYCYVGLAKPNHDIVIIGWDDEYPKENFTMDIEGDGAFICMNSWGKSFGNDGVFYVSYYDSNIGVHNIVYTDVENTDNFDNIYQNDYCGWIGQLGYGEESAYFATVYEAQDNESLEAVSFYATGTDTSYSVYVCSNYESISSLNIYVTPNAEGSFKNAGYYTVDLKTPVSLNAGEKYAVIVKIETPGATRPIAVEFYNDFKTESVSLEGKESYISLRGFEWENTQERHECTVCLKAFTNNR